MQWADKQSLELMADLLRGSYPIPALVLLVARTDERVAPLLAGIVRTELRGLTTDEQLRLLETRLNAREGVAAVSNELAARVGGNPFFLLEIVDALLERGALEVVEREDGSSELIRRAGQMPLPSTLEQLLAERLHELPSDEKLVAQWVAVAGGPLEVSVLRDLGAEAGGPDVVDEAIGRLCARGICDRKGETIDLRHPVARDVAYMTIEPAARSGMHRQLGERLRSTGLARGLSAAIVARHLARGDAPAPAAEMYMEAASAARASYQTALATRYFHRALSLLPEHDLRRFGAHEALESVYRMTGRRRERRKQLEEMRALAKTSKLPRVITVAMLRTARLDLDEMHLARGLPIAQKAITIAETTRNPNLLVESHALVIEFLRELGDVEGALRAANEALVIAQGAQVSHRLKADVLRAKGILLRRLGRTHEAVGVYADSIALLRSVGAKRSEARTKNALAYAMFVLARYEDAIALAMSSVALDLSIGGRFQIAKTLTNIGQCYARLGDLPRALAYLKRARDAHERYGDQDGRSDTLLVSSEILTASGDLDGAATFLGDARALVTVTGNAYDATHEMVARALWLRARGDARQAAELASHARPAAQSRGLASFHLFATAIEADARAEIGEIAQASLLAQTAIGLVEATEGSEFALEIRTLCARALERSADVLAPEAYARARAYARRVLQNIRDPRLRSLFLRRPEVAQLLGGDASSRGRRGLVSSGRRDSQRLSIAPGPPPSLRVQPDRARIVGPRRTAFVLSGGGARGAYEVGVLAYVLDELPKLRGGRIPRVDILCGTSVGAINACYLAAHADDFRLGVQRLLALWHDLEIARVLGFGMRQAVSLPRLLLGGGGDATGLFDVRPMADLIEREVGWRAVTRNLRKDHLRALSISTTEVSTGRTVIFMQTGPDVPLPRAAPPRTMIVEDRIGTVHALASAAIPILFPPVRIGAEYYCDGGLRLNTPIAPALRLGATHVFAVALSREVTGLTAPESGDPQKALGAAALLGKVLNAFLLDHVVNDLDVLARINSIFEDGVAAYGDAFVEDISAAARARGAELYRPVRCLALKPTEDIGRIAADHVARGKFRGSAAMARQLFKLLYLGGRPSRPTSRATSCSTAASPSSSSTSGAPTPRPDATSYSRSSTRTGRRSTGPSNGGRCISPGRHTRTSGGAARGPSIAICVSRSPRAAIARSAAAWSATAWTVSERPPGDSVGCVAPRSNTACPAPTWASPTMWATSPRRASAARSGGSSGARGSRRDPSASASWSTRAVRAESPITSTTRGDRQPR